MVNLVTAPMERWLSCKLDSLTAFLHVAACIVSVAMLLLFPAFQTHSFGPHFRNPEVRRATKRHTSIAHSDNRAEERIAQSGLLTKSFAPAEPDIKIVPRDNFNSPPEVSLARLLNRLKLNPPGSDGQDPPLQA